MKATSPRVSCSAVPRGPWWICPMILSWENPEAPRAPGGAGNGYFGDGQGVYKKILEVPPAWEGKTILLDIDGACMTSEVSVNQEVLEIHPNGYIPFQTDITKALWKDKRKNLIKIIVQSRQPSSRWYSGGGLYRDVCLWVGGPVHVRPWDFFITTPVIEKDRAEICVDMTVTGTEDAGRITVNVWWRTPENRRRPREKDRSLWKNRPGR